jgi:hypothetical protein
VKALILRGLKRAAACLALAGVITSCTLMVAETPHQRMYAAVSEFEVLTEAAAQYCTQPAPNVQACRQILNLFNQAAPLVQAIELAAQDPSTSPETLSSLLRALADILDRYAAAVAETQS